MKKIKQTKLTKDWVSVVINNPLVPDSQAQSRERNFGHFEQDGIIIDTCWCKDTGFIETGIIDRRYRSDGGWFIVDQYDEIDKAKEGHQKWINALMSEFPPDEILDISLNECLKLNV